MNVTIALDYPAPIPVGRRVEVTWYYKPAGMRGDKLKSAPSQPALVDLETGVRYGPNWAHGAFASFRPGSPNRYALEPLPELTVERRVVAKVLACTIVHVPVAEPYQETMLALEVEPAAA
jgi:hypothetical protein